MNIVYERVEDDEWQKFGEFITFNAKTPQEHHQSQYVKIPFKDASSLVHRRAVFLHKGMAFVPMKEFYSIASAHFRTRLS